VRSAHAAWSPTTWDLAPLLASSPSGGAALCGLAGTADVVDASVAAATRTHGVGVVTSDPDDIRRLDHRLDLTAV